MRLRDQADHAVGMIPPTIYYARVGGELAAMMVKGRNMYPP